MTFFQWERNFCVDQKFVFNFVFFSYQSICHEEVLQVIKTSLFISPCILRDLPQAEDPWGGMRRGRACYISTFPCSHGKMFWWDGSGKFKKHKEKRDRSGKLKKTRRKEWRKEKEEIFIVCGGSYTHVLFIVQDQPQATTIVQPSLRRTHLYGNLPYKKTTTQIGVWNKVICQVSVFFSLCWFATWNTFESHLWHHRFPSQVLSGYKTHLQVSFCLTH